MDSHYQTSIKQLQGLSEDLKHELIAQNQVLFCERNSYLVNPGMLHISCWLLLSGLAKKFHYTRGKYCVSRFWKEGQWITIEDCFMGVRPADSYIMTIEDCHLIPITYQQVANAHHWPFLTQLLLDAVQHHISKESLFYFPLEKRYLHFIKMFPAARIMDKDIASYLHADPSYLSRRK